jgi:hypothetical protein
MGQRKGYRPPGGSRKGVPNKVTRDIREMIRESLDRAGGVAYLVKQATLNPASYLALVSKIIPQQINATIRRELPEMSREDLLMMLEDMRVATAGQLVQTKVIEHDSNG